MKKPKLSYRKVKREVALLLVEAGYMRVVRKQDVLTKLIDLKARVDKEKNKAASSRAPPGTITDLVAVSKRKKDSIVGKEKKKTVFSRAPLEPITDLVAENKRKEVQDKKKKDMLDKKMQEMIDRKKQETLEKLVRLRDQIEREKAAREEARDAPSGVDLVLHPSSSGSRVSELSAATSYTALSKEGDGARGVASMPVGHDLIENADGEVIALVPEHISTAMSHDQSDKSGTSHHSEQRNEMFESRILELWIPNGHSSVEICDHSFDSKALFPQKRGVDPTNIEFLLIPNTHSDVEIFLDIW